MGKLKIYEESFQKRLPSNPEEFWRVVEEMGELELYLKKGNTVVYDHRFNCRDRQECFAVIGELLEKVSLPEGVVGFLVVRRGEETYVGKLIFSREEFDIEV